MITRVHKVLTGATVVIGITLGILGRLRLLWLLGLGRWFFLLFAVALTVEFFWSIRSMTRSDRGGRRFIMVITSITSLGSCVAGSTVRWGWWLAIVAVLWVPQLFPTNRFLKLETRYDTRGRQWLDTLLMAIPAAAVMVGIALLAHHLHQIQVTEAAHCPAGLYKLMSLDHSSFSCVHI